MCGQGCPLGLLPGGDLEPLGGDFGVVVVFGDAVVVDWVVVAVELLGAAAAPAIPATAPPPASAATARPTPIIFDLLIREPPSVGCTPAILQALAKRSRTPA